MICKHCGSPNRFNPCWYYDNMKSQDAEVVRQSGADRPCDCDEWYERTMRREAETRRYTFALVLAVVAGVVISILIL